MFTLNKLRIRFVASVFMAFSLMMMSSAQETQDTPPTYHVVGYYASWNIYSRSYYITDIPGDKLTHINYAFANISDEGECMLGDEYADTQFEYPGDVATEILKGNFKQLNLLKEAYPHLRTLLSIGGWTWSEKFSDAALNDESRAKFAASCVAMMKQYGFDGLDIDWEYPVGGGEEDNVSRPEDKQNYTLLLAELRKQLDAQGEADGEVHYLLTIAAPASAYSYNNFELGKIHEYLDWVNIMAYDFAGAWNAVTDHHAALYASEGSLSPDLSGDAAVRAYLNAGIPAEKIVLGVPFFGRGWSGVGERKNGLHQTYASTYGDEGGFLHYLNLSDLLLKAQRHWDEQAQAPWLYDPVGGIMVSYDDPESLALKAEYIAKNGLGGVMIWELGIDDRDHTLLNALAAKLLTTETE